MHHATKQPSKAARCVEAYEKLRASSMPGRPYDLAKLSREERLGLYLSAAARSANELELSVVERVALLELLELGGLESWRRVFGDGLVELVQEVYGEAHPFARVEPAADRGLDSWLGDAPMGSFDPALAAMHQIGRMDDRRFITEEGGEEEFTYAQMQAVNSSIMMGWIDRLKVGEGVHGEGQWVRRVK